MTKDAVKEKYYTDEHGEVKAQKDEYHTEEVDVAAAEKEEYAEENEEHGFEENRAVPARVPSQPTAREIEAHRAAHTQYRAWCEACVRGRGLNADHRRLAAESEHLIDTISIDYAFFGEKDQTAKPVLIVREHRCKWTEAIPVLNKGSQDTWAVKSLAESVRRTGLKRFIF